VFADVAGQSHVLKSLINALDNQRLHHAYLFTGTRGVGKTTLARILARCLNCEAGVSSTPCGSCSACLEISEGRFVDLIEVDAASRTKVEDTRELLENVQYLPTRGRYKVYLIDEVHMLSQHSFNALLKTLEEPPEHVKFLLATTDPQKLPITVLSRCLQFSLKNLSPQLIAEFIAQILDSEGVDSERDALWQIAMAAAGSMRDALTLTDQAIAYCEGRVLTGGVTEMLGVPPQQQIARLLEAMATRDIADVMSLIKEIGEATPDYQHSLDALLSMLHRIALQQAVPGSVDDSAGDQAQVSELAAKFSAEDVQLYYQMGLKGREDLRLAVEMRSAFEMVLLRMLVFSPQFVPLGAAEGADSAADAEQKKKTLAPTDSGLEPEREEINSNFPSKFALRFSRTCAY
jgi:DNA polymerase-3 subunit gamma/tau